MNRREALKATFTVATAAAVLRPRRLASQDAGTQAPGAAGNTFFVNPATGADANPGTKNSPLRTLAGAARRVNTSDGVGPMTIVLSEGIHAIGETTWLKPERRSFSATARLTIRAEVLPDNPEWHTGRMPTLIHTMPVPTTWNGRPDPLGGAADGMMVETSHVTIQGLKILGLPVVESPKPGVIRRLYAISRLRRDLEDLEIAQCLFAGDEVTNPNHVAIIAHGNGVRVHHCIFRGLKISVVYWTPGSSGHAMRNCLCHDLYGSGVWTSGVANCNYVWTSQGGASSLHYKVVDSYFASNRRLTGTGTGARLEYRDIDSSFLELVGTKVSESPIVLERDQTKRRYLHPSADSDAAKIGAGLFMKPQG